MPRSGGTDAREATRTPSEGPSARHAIPSPQIAYCQGCGHDTDRHRRGKCWTDALGNPVTRARTHIDCPCQEDQP